MASAGEPETALQGFIGRFSPEIAALTHACRAALRERLPTAVELVYDNYQALAIGYASSERQRDCVVSLAVFPKNVALSFYYGVQLPDPAGRLSGNGKQNRFVRIEMPGTLHEPEVSALIDTALAIAERPMPSAGSGHTIIKSISARQRPRRTEGNA